MRNRIRSAAVAAALAAPVAVWAQSTVVLYGIVDVSYQNISKYSAPGTSVGQKSAFGNSGMRSSRLGARATEDLGGGLSARAVIEFDVAGDTGQEGANGMTGRQTFVSLDSKNWGELSVGRQLTHSYGNVFLAEGIATANSFQTFFTMEDQIVRASNYLKYSSPKFAEGLTFGAGWAPGEDPTVSTATGSNKNNRNYFDWHLRWEKGPLGIGLAQAKFKQNTAGAAVGAVIAAPGAFPVAAQVIGLANTETDTSLAGYYKFSGWRLYGVHTRSTQPNATAPNVGERFRLNGARVEVDIGKGVLALAAAKRRNKLLANADSSFWGVGYYHSMSTRTQFYATIGRMKNEDGVAGVGGGTLTLGGAWTGPTVAAGADPRGFQLGMGHSF